jgi:hypothetical protein
MVLVYKAVVGTLLLLFNPSFLFFNMYFSKAVIVALAGLFTFAAAAEESAPLDRCEGLCK